MRTELLSLLQDLLGESIVLKGVGGPGRDRTDDLFHAMEARSQLRHRPTKRKEYDFNSRPRLCVSQTPAGIHPTTIDGARSRQPSLNSRYH